jgi:hypothetical protein
VIGRDKDATWRSLGGLCRDLDWSQGRLLRELRGGLRYRTIPEGYVIDWRDRNVVRSLDVAASTVTLLDEKVARERAYIGLGLVTVTVEVLPPVEAEVPAPPANAPAATPTPPAERWRSRPPAAGLKAAALAAAKTFKPDDPPPTFPEWWAALDAKLGGHVAREVARSALADCAPRLRRKPGHKRNRRS